MPGRFKKERYVQIGSSQLDFAFGKASEKNLVVFEVLFERLENSSNNRRLASLLDDLFEVLNKSSLIIRLERAVDFSRGTEGNWPIRYRTVLCHQDDLKKITDFFKNSYTPVLIPDAELLLPVLSALCQLIDECQTRLSKEATITQPLAAASSSSQTIFGKADKSVGPCGSDVFVSEPVDVKFYHGC